MQNTIAPLVAEAVGAGPSIITLHASGLSSRQWARFVRDASARYRVLCADLLGVGRTSLGDAPYSLSREVDALLALIDRLDDGPVSLLAHSFGGLVAMEAALRAPSKIKSMALFEPVIVALAREAGSPEACAQLDAIRTLMARDVTHGYDHWLEGFIDWWNGPGFFRSLPAPTREQYRSTAHEAYRQAAVVPTSTITLEALKQLPIRTLFLTGTTSPEAARESVQLAVDVMPHAQLERIEGAGHMGPLTHASVVNSVVLRFFDAEYNQHS
jgi:pimeloyl-ACP methyl ester carboxylesterase